MSDEAPKAADTWLEAIDKAGLRLVDVPIAIPALDAMEALHTRPTVGWMLRNTWRQAVSAERGGPLTKGSSS